MPDEEIDARPRLYDGGVVLRMQTPGGFVVVRVSDAALDDCERSSGTRPDRRAVVERRRYAIEGIARRKLNARCVEKDGSVLITTTDMNG